MLLLYSILDIYPNLIPSLFFRQTTKIHYVSAAAIIKMFRFIYFSLLMYIFLKTPILLHQKISIGIIIFGITCILVIGEFLRIWNNNEADFLTLFQYLAVYLFSYFLTSCKAIVAKWLMDYKFFSPYQMLFINGIIKALMTGVTYVIILFCFPNCDFSFCGSIMEPLKTIFTEKYIGYYIGFFFGSMLTNTFYMLTISFLSPVYIGISDGIGGMIIWIVFIIVNNIINKYLLLLTIIFFVMIIFGGMMYTENLVLKCCGLDLNTKDAIAERATKNFKTGNIAFYEDSYSGEPSEEALVKESFGTEL